MTNAGDDEQLQRFSTAKWPIPVTMNHFAKSSMETKMVDNVDITAEIGSLKSAGILQ